MWMDTGKVVFVLTMSAFASASHAQPVSSGAVYSCTDAGGRRLTADRPIAACADREQQMTLSGGVTRVIGPTVSEKERAEQAAQQRREAEERYRANDGKRRERALAARFPNKAAHDVERDEALGSVRSQIKSVQERKQQLQQDRETNNLEMEFYKADHSKAPLPLQSRYKNNKDELKEADDQQAALNEEIKRTNQRFDTEAQMLKQYWTPASK